MKREETALAPRTIQTVSDARLALEQARSQLVASARALKSDLRAVERGRDFVRRHPWLSLGAAFALGVWLAGPHRNRSTEGGE